MHFAMRDAVTYWNVEMLSIYPVFIYYPVSNYYPVSIYSSREPVTSNVMSS